MIAQLFRGYYLYALLIGSACNNPQSDNPAIETAPVTFAHNRITDTSGSVSWNAIPGNPYYQANSNGEFYLYITVKGNKIESMDRAPLNISLVLDRSGSMEGDKLSYAKQAAAFVVKQLSADDILSLVCYDSEVDLLSAATKVHNKEILQNKIEKIDTRGSTNLSGGMLEGYHQTNSHKRDGYVNRVLLLTDGLANQGITDPLLLNNIVEQKYLEEGIALSTFGLGADYNEDLLTNLAETGRANYYFIQNPDQVPEIFAKELKGLLSVVALNSSVKIDFPQGIECINVFGYPYKVKGNSLTISLNDLFSDDEKSMVIKFKSTKSLHGNISFNTSLSYTDAATLQSNTYENSIELIETNNRSLVDKSVDKLVEEMIVLFETNEVFDQVMADVDAGNYDRATNKADEAIRYLKQKQRSIPSAKLKKQEEIISGYHSRMSEVKQMEEQEKKVFQKSGKSENYKIKKGRE